jgi:translation initiation factor IF-2
MTGTTDTKDQKGEQQADGAKKTLTLGKKLDIKKIAEKDQVRQSFAHGRSKTVEVEVKRKRVPFSERVSQPPRVDEKPAQEIASESTLRKLTGEELENRMRALKQAIQTEEVEQPQKEEVTRETHLAEGLPEEIPDVSGDVPNVVEALPEKEKQEPSTKPEIRAEKQSDTRQPHRNTERKKTISIPENFTPIVLRAASYGPSAATTAAAAAAAAATKAETAVAPGLDEFSKDPLKAQAYKQPSVRKTDLDLDDEDSAVKRKAPGRVDVKKVAAVPPRKGEEFASRKLGRSFLTKALNGDSEERTRSMASIKRARQKHRQDQNINDVDMRVVREVIIPESITVAELSNRMAVRAAEVVKTLMKLGMMVTINQLIDADTAELVCSEFGHKFKRVADSDIEIGLGGVEDGEHDLIPRPPVVTIMGHVDHGKTSLLDALRQTDVVSGEAGGITQHIGAYQVTLKSGKKITFIDTPGHAAFSEMRARGANLTDVVVLVVAADDGIKEQTIEAISHAKAAQVPIVVAINKMDKPGANPERVRSELLQHGLVLEEYGGEILAVEVSAKKLMNLDKLEEAILLQAEILDLKANPNRLAHGVVVEARMEKGRGTVATVLIQKGTLRGSDIFVAGTEFGRVRAIISDHGKHLKEAIPGMPVEVLGFNGTPSAGDEFFVVEEESKAREITDYRVRRKREQQAIASARGSMEQMMSKIAAGEVRELPVVIKTDVQGSLEAISASLGRLGTDEVTIRVLHGAVGGINESDVSLARASGGIIIGFNVRANPQARDLARRDGVDMRYYSIIYDVLDDMKGMMGGLLAPTIREKYLGVAEIRTVFSISKLGKIAGCYVTEGIVKRGSKVRLLRDNVVIYEGDLKSLKRFKDEVKEVKDSYECGMAFENYNDIREGDIIECFEMESIARQL